MSRATHLRRHARSTSVSGPRRAGGRRFRLGPGADNRPRTSYPKSRSLDHLGGALRQYSRTNELRDVLVTGAPTAAVRSGHVCAYLAAPTNWLANHGVAETDEDMRALLVGAARMARQPLSFLLPVRRAALLRWCVTQDFRSSRPMTLMTIGEYREPQKPYCPSVNY
jgi:hypothetical protein